MVTELIIIGIIMLVVLVAAVLLLKFAVKIALVVVIIALIVCGGIYLFAGKEGLHKSLEITGAAIEDVKDSEMVSDAAGYVKNLAKESAKNAWEAGTQQAKELLNKTG